MKVDVLEIPRVYVMNAFGEFVCAHTETDVVTLELDPIFPDQKQMHTARAILCTQCKEYVDD